MKKKYIKPTTTSTSITTAYTILGLSTQNPLAGEKVYGPEGEYLGYYDEYGKFVPVRGNDGERDE